MNKRDLIDSISEQTDVTKSQAEAILNVTLETIIDTVSDGERVTLVGFGSFEKRYRNAREGRNPKTGEPLNIPATDVPAFSAGKTFKEQVAF